MVDDKKDDDADLTANTDGQEDDNGDEIIEVVDCPGVDGTRQRNTQRGQRVRTRVVI